MRFLLAATLLLAGCSAPSGGDEQPLNSSVIMADDLDYGDLSTYGGWIDTPNLDRMAADSLKFADFHSNGAVCSPTRAALVTGRYQQRGGACRDLRTGLEGQRPSAAAGTAVRSGGRAQRSRSGISRGSWKPSGWSRGAGSAEGKRLQKLRTEEVERSMVHMYEAGGLRRLYLRGGRTFASGCRCMPVGSTWEC